MLLFFTVFLCVLISPVKSKKTRVLQTEKQGEKKAGSRGGRKTRPFLPPHFFSHTPLLLLHSARPACAFFHSRSTAVSAAPHARTLPASASVVYAPVYTPSAFRWPMLICTEAWSLAVISLLVHELWGVEGWWEEV